MLDYIMSCIDGYFETLMITFQYDHPLIDYHYPRFKEFKEKNCFDETDYPFILEIYEDIHYVFRCALEY